MTRISNEKSDKDKEEEERGERGGMDEREGTTRREYMQSLS